MQHGKNLLVHYLKILKIAKCIKHILYIFQKLRCYNKIFLDIMQVDEKMSRK
jgi:hypothetical protein